VAYLGKIPQTTPPHPESAPLPLSVQNFAGGPHGNARLKIHAHRERERVLLGTSLHCRVLRFRLVQPTSSQPPLLWFSVLLSGSTVYGIISKRRCVLPHNCSLEKNQVPKESALIAISLAGGGSWKLQYQTTYSNWTQNLKGAWICPPPPGIYCIKRLSEIMRLSAFKSPLFYPSS
jgi:hypothetical protein